MKKRLCLLFLTFSLSIFSKEISIESGYINSTNESSYDGLYLQSAIPLHNFTTSLYVTAEPFIHIIDSTVDPGIMFNLSKEFPFSHNFKFLVYGGIGVMYLNNDDTDQHDNFNFKENLGIGILYTLTPDIEVALKGTIWHISNAGITSSNTGIDGNTIGISIKKNFR